MLRQIRFYAQTPGRAEAVGERLHGFAVVKDWCALREAAAQACVSPIPNVIRYGGNFSSKERAACMSATAKPSVN
jgi:hypothetical protein